MNITVLDTKVFPELQKKYLANPKSGKCPFFNVGDNLCAETDGGTGRFLPPDERQVLR